MAVADVRGSPFTAQGYISGGLRDPQAQGKLLADVPPGLHVSRRTLPPGVVVVEDYLSPRICAELLAYARQQPGTPSTVKNDDASGRTLTRLSAERVTDYIDIEGVAADVHVLMRDIFVNQVGRHYGTAVEWFERPELLRYRPGGHYSPHADAENWDAVSRGWQRSIDRDFSILLYLNDDFEGGGLEFPNFGLRLTPRAGMLVGFPSDHRYVHSAEPITAGERFVMVCWCAARGTPRVGKSPPVGATLLEQA